MDGADIGLANFELFVSGRMSPLFTESHQLTAASIAQEVRNLAAKTREIAIEYLRTPAADWEGLQNAIAQRGQEALKNAAWNNKRD
jgi:hypothetical protein